MADIYKLRNQVKHYEWGSPYFIPRLMGLAPDGAPWAELWMGTHSSAISQIIMPSGAISLAEQYGSLPFLFKLLAAEKPLSIQAHPNKVQAGEGFDRENKAGLAPDAPNRNYKDPYHKPEIICALSPFTGMCGFREPEEIRQLLAVLIGRQSEPSKGLIPFIQPPSPVRESFVPLIEALKKPHADFPLKHFLKALFELSPKARNTLTEFILSLDNTGEEMRLMRDFAGLYPGDPALIAPLYLNVFHLEPGEAVFLDAGVLHSYISGFGVELMANSDNVLRGGLTAKHIDIPELMKVLNFCPSKPHIIKPVPVKGRFSYPSPCKEFLLSVIHGAGNTKTNFTANSPSIGIVTEGEVSVAGMILKQGESAFFAPAAAPLVLEGHYTLYIASVPQ